MRLYPARRFQGKDVTIGDVFEGVGAHNVGNLSDEELHELECAACPSAGSCGGLFTANTMACRLRGDRPGIARLGRRAGALRFARRLCRGVGQTVMELIRRNIRPRDIVTRKAIENAATIIAAAGGSTNGGCICRRSPTSRHRILIARFRRNLEAHPVYRRSEARRRYCDEGPP